MSKKIKSYIKTSDRRPPELNKQNMLIAVAYELVNAAALKLFGLGITIESIHIESGTPLITISAPADPKPLNAVLIRSINDSAGHKYLHRAFMWGCRLEWTGVIE